MLRNQMGCFLLALLLVCPIWGLAAEGDSFATYVMPEGAETLFVTDISQFEAPQGMETMYAAMGRVTSKGDIYMIRKKNGRALASVRRASGVRAKTGRPASRSVIPSPER